ncbi:MAG: serine/threonine-protein kinase [Granulosicoccus sp.]
MNSSLSPMDSVIGGYKLMERIGRGGSGTVYRCHKLSNASVPLALKVLHQPVNDDVRLRQFQRECDTQCKLVTCPGVVTLIDHGVEMDGTAWLVMEHCDISYAERLLTLGEIPADEVIEIGYQLATTLAHAHALKVIHGDIKPSNVFLSNEGYTLLGDFGASVDLDQTITAQCDLSFAYVAPETLRHGVVSIQSDFYALGATLYHLASGKSPLPVEFHNSARMPLVGLMEHLEQSAVPPLALLPSYKSLSDLVARLMSSKPENRSSNAKQLVRQFKAMQSGTPVLIKPMMERHEVSYGSDTLEPAWWRGRMQTGIFAGIAISLIVFGIVSLLQPLSFWPINSQEKSAPTAATSNNQRTDNSVAISTTAKCDPTAYLCESFETDLELWESAVELTTASLSMTDESWQGQALSWDPTNSDQAGGSFLYRVVATPVSGQSVRIRTRLKAIQRGSGYFWMTAMQFASSEGHTWSLNLQLIRDARLAFDLLYYNGGAEGDDAVATHVPFLFDRWLCVELIIDPQSPSLLQLFVDGQYTGQLSSPASALDAESYEVLVGSTDVQSPRTAPRLLYDDLIVERGAKPVCGELPNSGDS